MLEVRVRNFQSIKDATVVIDGFTALTGTNNTGKSALIRAIKGVFTNPAPSFVRFGATHATVEITDGDLYVKWEKGGGKNDYTLRTPEKGQQVFRNVGKAGAPPQVLEAFGVGSFRAGNSVLWPQIADWKSGPLFLLDKPGSAIADGVANVERIEVLNRALKACETDRRQTASTLKLRNKDQDEIDAQLEAFECLEEIVEDLDSLQSQRSQAERIKTGHVKLVQLKRQYENARSKVVALEGFDEIESDVPSPEAVRETREMGGSLRELVRLRNELRGATSRLEALRDLEGAEGLIPPQDVVTGGERLQEGLHKIRQLRDRIKPLQAEVKQWTEAAEIAQEADLGDEEALRAVNRTRQALRLLKGMRTEINVSKGQIAEYEVELCQKQEELATLQEELGGALEEFDECPLCGAAIDHACEEE